MNYLRVSCIEEAIFHVAIGYSHQSTINGAVELSPMLIGWCFTSHTLVYPAVASQRNS
jgi:hypothetical protein